MDLDLSIAQRQQRKNSGEKLWYRAYNDFIYRYLYGYTGRELNTSLKEKETIFMESQCLLYYDEKTLKFISNEGNGTDVPLPTMPSGISRNKTDSRFTSRRKNLSILLHYNKIT